MSVPFAFCSENANGVSSMYCSSAQDMINPRSKMLKNAGASIISVDNNFPSDNITSIRIRGKHTEMREGIINKTIEQQEKIKLHNKEVKKFNERLKNLDKIEKFRQSKVKEEIEKLEQQRIENEMLKQQRLKDDIEKRAIIVRYRKEMIAKKEERAKLKQQLHKSSFL